MSSEFKPFPKIARLSREFVITEKIDGTNASIFIGDAGEFLVGSRTRWITPDNDNFGFAAWAHERKDELMSLGHGHHFGEWWGSGIQRGYNLPKGEKRFSLFNVSRWDPEVFDWLESIKTARMSPKSRPAEPALFIPPPDCCKVVPVLRKGTLFQTEDVFGAIEDLAQYGSHANFGFMNPEGVVVFHMAANIAFKKTIEKDDEPKGAK